MKVKNMKEKIKKVKRKPEINFSGLYYLIFLA